VLTRLDLRGTGTDIRDRLPSPAIGGEGQGLAESTQAVRAILDRVRVDGDVAVRELTRQFDGVAVDDLRVPDAEVTAALGAIPTELRTAMQVAHDNIVTYHRTQLHDDTRQERDGLVVRDLTIPVDRAGLYVPGGRAPLASTVLMTAGPARVAGVNGLALCSPPGPDGRLPAPILAAAAIAGVDEVYRVGGAQAIAALA
jgi:histidinol dehydrogenase